MVKDESFKKGLNCPGATEAQKEVAMRKMIHEIYEEFSSNGIGSKLEDIVKVVGDRYGISDSTKLLKKMTTVLQNKTVRWQLDENGYIYVNPFDKNDRKEGYQERENRIAEETMQKYVEELKSIGVCDVETIKKHFNPEDLEKDSLWIELAARRVWGCQIEIHPRFKNSAKNEANALEEH